MTFARRTARPAQRQFLPGLLLGLASVLSVAGQVPPAVDPPNNEIAVALSEEPRWLNTIKATDQVSFTIIDHISEGLLTHSVDNELTGGVAERWQLTDTTATFWLRRDARWSDGKPVTAHDFVFAWQEVANPASASEYAFMMRILRNGADIIAGQLPPAALGVTAPDDYTLVAHLTAPTAYLLELMTFISFRPVREDYYRAQGDRYAADADKLLSNGPFMLTQWVHGASLRMVRNPHYWNVSAIHLQAINVPYITADPNARFNLYMDGKIAIASSLDYSATKIALQRRQKLRSFRDGAVFFIEFNQRADRPTRNLNLRRAMQHVYDAAELTYKVIGLPGNAPAYSMFPSWLDGDEDKLTIEYPPRLPVLDVAIARRCLERARRELQLDEIPPLTLLLSDIPNSVKQAEYFQNVMSRTLGLDIKLDRQIFKQRLDKMSAGEFDLVAAGWGPDYNDAMTFADLFASWNLNNRGLYRSDRYDQLVAAAQATTDQRRRNRLFGEMQTLLYDDVVVLPQYERGYIYVQHQQLEGVRRSRFGGDVNFNYARIKSHR